MEKTRRGLYGGVVGHLDFAGNADFAIAVRTALMRNGTSLCQADAVVWWLQRITTGHNEARQGSGCTQRDRCRRDAGRSGANRSGC